MDITVPTNVCILNPLQKFTTKNNGKIFILSFAQRLRMLRRSIYYFLCRSIYRKNNMERNNELLSSRVSERVSIKLRSHGTWRKLTELVCFGIWYTRTEGINITISNMTLVYQLTSVSLQNKFVTILACLLPLSITKWLPPHNGGQTPLFDSCDI
jgi:hypothetical protein